jgi:hypothetical protein
MSEEGAGGFTMAYCHECQGLLSLAGDGFIHLDGTPLCKGGAMTEGNPFDAARVAYGAGQRDGINEAKRVVAGFLDIDEKGDRRCDEPSCDLCVVAPLIYAALEDLILSKGDQP